MSKKIIDITKLVVLFIILVLLILIFTNFVKGGKPSMSINRSNPDLYEEYTEVSKVQCDMSSCSFNVAEYDGDKVVVKAYCGGFPKAPLPKVSMEGSVLKIEQKSIHIGILLYDNVEVFVPKDSKLDYSLKTASGSIKLDAQSKEAILASASGSVKVYQGGETLDLNCTSGSVKVYEPFVKESIRCISGSVKSIAGKQSESLDISCTSGSVTVQLDPSDIGYEFSAKAVSGSVRDEYHDIRFGDSASGSYGDKKLSLQIHTTSGSIRLEDWD